MFRRITGVVAAVVLLAGAAGAASTTITTTSTTSTTSTTLLPHPFSPATQACVHEATDAKRACRATDGATCFEDFQAAYPSCFAANTGVKCAARCVSRQQACLGSAPSTEKTCRKACVTTRKADQKACRRIPGGEDSIWAGGDASCLATAAANFELCKFVCAEATVDCAINFKFCIADCPNL